MPKYTIESAMKTGKKSPTYGEEFYVKFEESEDTFTLWYKTAPKKGQEQAGEIKGSKFTKEKAPYNGKASAPNTGPKKTYNGNSDGQRQGMCINNASNYVNSLDFEKTLTDREWAKTVHAYATALYVLGDLMLPTDNPALEDLLSGD